MTQPGSFTLKIRGHRSGTSGGIVQVSLVTTRRDGYYVLYSLVPERIAPLSDALLRFLGDPRSRPSVD